MWTCNDYKSLGPTAQAVCSHFPSPIVLEEAYELDRELLASPRSWETLLCRIEEFVGHYPSLLLHAPSALSALGNACQDGVHTAQQTDIRTRATVLLINTQNAISAAILREGVEGIEPEIPQVMRGWLSDLSDGDELARVAPQLVLPAILSFGKNLLMVADDGNPPQQWYALIYEADRLLLAVLQQQIPDGTTKSTNDVQLQRAREWLGMLEHALENNERTAADVFLELSAIAKRQGLQTLSPTGVSDVDAC